MSGPGQSTRARVKLKPYGAWTAHTLLGVNAAADPVNRLAVAAPATLLSHEGDGQRLKINKAQPGDTASLLFQTGWSGRAEMGCAGEEDFSVKVSADGTGWQTALRIARASGRVTLPEVAEVEAPLTGAGVVGTVSQLAGESTGALLGRGESASGSWLRLADGTQLCWLSVDPSVAGVVSWTFPVAFPAAPVVQAGGMAGSPHLVSAGAVSATGSGVVCLGSRRRPRRDRLRAVRGGALVLSVSGGDRL
ncbi:hypothetical protein [Salipiger bermudensis]|uniref:hypothetical protein n=1 Tax=Salipiger bermudensis TaxID=344736 RepID=UPI00300BA5AE